jgi:hypothetical protein
VIRTFFSFGDGKDDPEDEKKKKTKESDDDDASKKGKRDGAASSAAGGGDASSSSSSSSDAASSSDDTAGDGGAGDGTGGDGERGDGGGDDGDDDDSSPAGETTSMTPVYSQGRSLARQGDALPRLPSLLAISTNQRPLFPYFFSERLLVTDQELASKLRDMLMSGNHNNRFVGVFKQLEDGEDGDGGGDGGVDSGEDSTGGGGRGGSGGVAGSGGFSPDVFSMGGGGMLGGLDAAREGEDKDGKANEGEDEGDDGGKGEGEDRGEVELLRASDLHQIGTYGFLHNGRDLGNGSLELGIVGIHRLRITGHMADTTPLTVHVDHLENPRFDLYKPETGDGMSDTVRATMQVSRAVRRLKGVEGGREGEEGEEETAGGAARLGGRGEGGERRRMNDCRRREIEGYIFRERKRSRRAIESQEEMATSDEETKRSEYHI